MNFLTDYISCTAYTSSDNVAFGILYINFVFSYSIHLLLSMSTSEYTDPDKKMMTIQSST